jgi:hypothetical protein
MNCSSLKHSGSETNILSLDDVRAHIGPMMRSPRRLLMVRAPMSPPSPLAHHWATPTYRSIHSTQAALHIIKSTSKHEQLKLSKTDLST